MAQKLVFLMLSVYLLLQLCQAKPTEAPSIVSTKSEIAASSTVEPIKVSTEPAEEHHAQVDDSSKTTTLNEHLRLDNYTVVQGKNVFKNVIQQTGAVASAALQARIADIRKFIANIEKYLQKPSDNIDDDLFDLMAEFIKVGDDFDRTAQQNPDDSEITQFKRILAEQLDQLVDAIIDGGHKEFSDGSDAPTVQ